MERRTYFYCFFFDDTATTEIYTLSLHDALPISDLYAFGCVLFEMMTGRTPFVSETAPEMLFKHLDEEPPSVREFNINVPIYFDELIAELLEKDPNERPFDALAVQVKLDEVKERIAEGKSLAHQTASGRAGATVGERDPTLDRLLGRSRKKRRRKKKHVPVYERAWFLSLALVAVIGLLTWGFWPRSEEERFAEIEQPMSSTDSSDWYGVEYKLDDFLEDFPEGEHAAQVQQWVDRVGMARAENKAEMREQQGRDPESQAERLYMEARMFERFGDQQTARLKYEGMQPLFENDEKARPYVNLARRQARKIRDRTGGENDPVEFVKRQIRDADELYIAGHKAQAEKRWQSIVSVYQNSEDHQDDVRRVRTRLLSPVDTLMREYGDVPERLDGEPDPEGEQPQSLPPTENE